MHHRVFFILLLLAGCKHQPDKAKSIQQKVTDSLTVPVISATSEKPMEKKDSVESKPITEIHYSLVPNSDSLAHVIWKEYTGDSLLVMMALNRVDLAHMHKPDSLIIPDRFDSLLTYSPFPVTFPEVDSVEKIILVSARLQAYGFYQNGKLIKWGPVSMGKKTTPTPKGLYHTNWKAKSTISTDNAEWKLNWYFNLDNFRGVSFHEYELPGYPASHACIRLLADDAEFLYYFANQWKLNSEEKIESNGTPVIIFGVYNFGKRRPWRNLADQPEKAFVMQDEIVF